MNFLYLRGHINVKDISKDNSHLYWAIQDRFIPAKNYNATYLPFKGNASFLARKYLVRLQFMIRSVNPRISCFHRIPLVLPRISGGSWIRASVLIVSSWIIKKMNLPYIGKLFEPIAVILYTKVGICADQKGIHNLHSQLYRLILNDSIWTQKTFGCDTVY